MKDVPRTRTVKRTVTLGNQEPVEARWDEPIKGRAPKDGRTKNDFALIYVSTATAVRLANMPITGNDRRVLQMLTSMMLVNAPFQYNTTEIAKALHLHNSAVSRSIRALKEVGLLVQVDAYGRHYIHPDFYWRGDIALRGEAIELCNRVLKTGQLHE